MSGEEDGFIDRWSRRKSQTRSDGGLQRKTPETVEAVRGRMITEPLPLPETPSEPDESAAELVEVTNADAGASDQPEECNEQPETPESDVAELESINIEALGYDADFTRFMQPGVPEALRQRALKRLWRTNPILANVDGLNDYDEDYSDAAMVVGVLKSAYKVGQGYLTDEEVAERDAERLGEDGPVAEVGEDAELENTAPEDAGPETPQAGDGETSSPALVTNEDRTDDAVSRVALDEPVTEPDPTPA